MAKSDLYDAQVFQVTPITDTAGGAQLQVVGPLGTLHVLMSKAKARLRRLGVGEGVIFDVSMLVRNLPDNAWFWTYINAPPWLYVVITDTTSGYYGAIYRVEASAQGHAKVSEFSFHSILMCTEIRDSDKVYWEDGTLKAKG